MTAYPGGASELKENGAPYFIPLYLHGQMQFRNRERLDISYFKNLGPQLEQ
jgi:hypothetical protein